MLDEKILFAMIIIFIAEMCGKKTRKSKFLGHNFSEEHNILTQKSQKKEV